MAPISGWVRVQVTVPARQALVPVWTLGFSLVSIMDNTALALSVPEMWGLYKVDPFLPPPPTNTEGSFGHVRELREDL